MDINEILAWFQKSENQDKLIIGLVTAFLLFVIGKVYRLFTKRFESALFFIRKRGQRSSQLLRYRDRLEEDTFRIRHSWMKEDQTLEDILVSVNVTGSQDGGVRNLTEVLSDAFGDEDRAFRAIITGSPGSGKSVAMKMTARLCWDLRSGQESPPLTPVLMTFADYRRAGFNLEEAAIQSLEEHAFSVENDLLDARQFVTEALPKGLFLIIIDGLDELKKEDRGEAVAQLIRLLRAKPGLPMIISCRTAPFQAYRTQLQTMFPIGIEMARFPPAAIRDFIFKWRFDGHKSSQELWSLVQERPHLNELARNPLMLTITCYLYSLPKYRLPDNRAQFYEVCCRALLEEWDQAVNVNRANHFDRPHKEEILARLAHDHLSGPDPDRDIEENHARQFIATCMETHLGLIKGENIKLLDEIKENSGLLISLPPNGLRFPHQTFMEYFGAMYFANWSRAEDLVSAYAQDPKRWREVVLLFCGLVSNADQVTLFINNAMAQDDLEMALELLLHARQTQPETVKC